MPHTVHDWSTNYIIWASSNEPLLPTPVYPNNLRYYNLNVIMNPPHPYRATIRNAADAFEKWSVVFFTVWGLICFSFQNELFCSCESFWYVLWLLGQGTGSSQRLIAMKETSLSRVRTRGLCVLSAQNSPHGGSGLSLIQTPKLNLKLKSADVEVHTRCHFQFFFLS